MSVREYIGARYVPLFADPIEWDNTKTYEPLTIVYYQGNSYTSRQAVPTGIAITNEDYWALTGNYNAQIEAYREEVAQYAGEVAEFDERIDDVEDALPLTEFDSTNTVNARFTAIEAKFPVDKNDVKNNVLYKSSDPIYYGADNTGTNDSSDAIDACIAANFGKTIVFTPGTYKVSRAIKTPYTPENRLSIDFNGSIIVFEGVDSQKAVLEIGTYEGDVSALKATGSNSRIKNYYSNFTIVSNSLCTSAVYIETHYMNSCLENFAINTQTNGIVIADSNDQQYPSDVYITNGLIWADYNNALQVGVTFNGTDNKIEYLRVYNFKTFFNIYRGGNTIINVHTLGINQNSQNGVSFLVQAGFNTFNEIYNDAVATAFKFTTATSGQQISNFIDYSYNSELADRTFIHLDGATDIPAISVVNAHIYVDNNYTGFKNTNMNITPINLPKRITFDNVTFNKDVTLIISDNDYIRSASNLKTNSYYPPNSGTWGLVGTMIFTDQYKGGDLIYQKGDKFGAFSISRSSASNFTVAKHTYQGSAVNFGISVDSTSLIQNAVSVKVYINQPDSSSQPFNLITDFCSQLGCIFLPKYLFGVRTAISGSPSITTS